MTSIIPTPAYTNPRHKFVTKKTTNRLNHKPSSPNLFSFSISNSKVFTSSLICSCNNNNNDNIEEKGYKKYVKNAINWFDNYISGYKIFHMNNDDKNKDDDVIEDSGDVTGDADWDWERWKKHFVQVDQQERLLSILKSHLKRAILKEDYEDAARIKVAIAAAATNDTVGRVMSHLRKAIKEERYMDAAFVRDYAGAGLVGWWAGLSDDNKDPYGRIIRVSAEHGRYLARSYSPRQLATASDGAPLFEVFLTMNDNGEYKYQAVYLKRPEVPRDLPAVSSKSSPFISSTKLPEIVVDKGDLLVKDIEDKDNDYEMDDDDDDDDDNDSDMAEESAFENILRDMIPGAKDLKVEVLNVTKPEKIDRSLINKVVEEVADEEDEKEKDTDSEDLDGTNEELDDIDVDSDSSVVDSEGKSQIAVKIIVGGLVQKVSNGTTRKQLIRVPAKLEKRSRSSFTFSIEKEKEKEKQLVSSRNAQSIKKKDTRIRGNRSTESVMLDLANSIGKGKIPMKVLKDVGQMINLTLNEAKNRQPLSGSTTFNRIDLPKTSDPLNGLYVGAHGLYTSEVIHLNRKFGQWQEDGGMKEPSALEFYEYVEAVKLTGDPYVPAGQVAFRAKVGIQYQLPHKGIIPEEFGVIARYRGQGRLADPGFENPRWVDGELVVLDGKYIKAGPVVGFVYWAPEYQFLVFFNQLRLQN